MRTLPKAIMKELTRAMMGKGSDEDNVAGCKYCKAEGLTRQEACDLLGCALARDCPFGKKHKRE